MKELVKPIKQDKEFNNPEIYCEGGNVGTGYCPTVVSCPDYNFNSGECGGWSSDNENDVDILF